MRGSTKQSFWNGLKRKLGFHHQSPAAVVQAELHKDTHNVPPGERQRGGKKNSGGGGGRGLIRRGPRSMPGYLGYLRGNRVNAVKARLDFIYESWREANRIAAEKRFARLQRERNQEVISNGAATA
jgi:hypothetical protein